MAAGGDAGTEAAGALGALAVAVAAEATLEESPRVDQWVTGAEADEEVVGVEPSPEEPELAAALPWLSPPWPHGDWTVTEGVEGLAAGELHAPSVRSRADLLAAAPSPSVEARSALGALPAQGLASPEP